MSKIYQHEKILNRYQSIIFDLDGTLYDSDQFYTGAFEDMGNWLVQQGLLDASLPWVDGIRGLQRAKGIDYGHLIDDTLALLNIDSTLLTPLLDLYRHHDCRHLELDHRDRTCLENLKQSGKQMFIVTNGQKTVQTKKIERLCLFSFIKEVVILAPNGNLCLKPDPDAFDYLSRQYILGRTIMVGDRLDLDGMFAQNASIDFLGVCAYEN